VEQVTAAEHVHGCRNCQPDRFPIRFKEDPNYHERGKCVDGFSVMLNDEPYLGWTRGVMEGVSGWLVSLSASGNVDELHDCPTCTGTEGEFKATHLCETVLYGKVSVIHEVGCYFTTQKQLDTVWQEIHSHPRSCECAACGRHEDLTKLLAKIPGGRRGYW